MKKVISILIIPIIMICCQQAALNTTAAAAPNMARLPLSENSPSEDDLPLLEDVPPEDNLPPEEPSGIIRMGKLDLPEEIISPVPASYGSPRDKNGELLNKTMGWYYKRNKNHQPPTAQHEFDIGQFGGHYLGDINEKVIYLTFDEGYEKGFTPHILDTLKRRNVKAAFFLTKPYIRDNPELVNRMIDEGHMIGNHSVTHPSLPSLTDGKIRHEIEETARYFEEVTGHEIGKFFRPPKGEYSARTLKITQELGYESIFWSFAYQDWLVDNQPDIQDAYEIVMNNLHNGEIILLHAVSSANAEALGDIIDSIREQGFRFGTLDELK